MPSHGKSEAKTESKTAKLDRINAECENLEQKIAENDALISSLEQQYQVDADGRLAYKKSTHEKLSKAYDKREKHNAELQQKQAEYAIVNAEPELSSDEESTRSWGSRSSSRRSDSSKSSDPAFIGWDCGSCGRSNLNDPWGLDNRCGCGHRYCDNDWCCAVQFNP